MPLLILVAGIPERAATATSLLAIAITASAGVIVFSFRGEVEVGYAALVGLPAAVGVLAGTRVAATRPHEHAHLWLRSAADRHRNLAARVVSASTIAFAHRSRPGGRRARGHVRRRRRHPLRPHARRARARAARGTGHFAARDPSDGARRRLEPAPLRQPPRADGGRRRTHVDRRESRSARGSSRSFRRPRCARCSPSCSSAWRPSSCGERAAENPRYPDSP